MCSGSLAKQSQDELGRRFQLPFTICTSVAFRAARPDNWFERNDLVIARLDMLSRNQEVQELLRAPECRWDLVVCDEPHKMSASYFGRKIRYTKRYRLGQMIDRLTRHFLPMTATPHNGKEDDFQIKKRTIIGFALTVLQRSLASLPEAIHRSLSRRHERLWVRLWEMERAKAKWLQPHFIESFFLEAFKHLGETARQREPRR